MYMILIYPSRNIERVYQYHIWPSNHRENSAFRGDHYIYTTSREVIEGARNGYVFFIKVVKDDSRLYELKRYVNKVSGDNIITINSNLRILKKFDYSYERTEGFIYAEQVEGTVPLYLYQRGDVIAIVDLIPKSFLNYLSPEDSRIQSSLKIKETDVIFRDRNDIDAVLGVKDLAAVIASIIDQKPERGRMIGIFGKWGRGKTFLMDEIWNVLSVKNNFHRIDFHAWKYQQNPATWAYLYELFVDKYLGKSNWIVRFWKTLKLNIKRNVWWPVVKLAVSAVAYIVSVVILLRIKQIEYILLSVSLTTGLFLAYVTHIKKIYDKYSLQASSLIKSYTSKQSYKDALGLQAEIQKELVTLLKCWLKDNKSKKILLFVEDIDRCSEDRILEIIDSLRVMLDEAEIADKVVVLAAIDEEVLQLSIGLKYKHLIDFEAKGNIHSDVENKDLNNVINGYLDKLFSIGIKLGSLSSEERDEYFIELSKKDREKETVINFPLRGKIGSNLGSVSVELEPNHYQNEHEHLNNVADNKATFLRGLEKRFSKSKYTGIRNKESTENAKTINNKLNEAEVEAIRDCLGDFNNVTPRKIRIIYLRILLAKKLLIRRYSYLNKNNIWEEEAKFKFFVLAVFEYSIVGKSALVNSHKINAIQNSEEFLKMDLFPDVEIPKVDYVELLKILEIVIAY